MGAGSAFEAIQHAFHARRAQAEDGPAHGRAAATSGRLTRIRKPPPQEHGLRFHRRPSSPFVRKKNLAAPKVSGPVAELRGKRISGGPRHATGPR